MKGREEMLFTVLIQEIKEVGNFSNLLICEPYMLEGSSRTAMESLAVVVATETIAPRLTMDTKVTPYLFSTATTSTNCRSLQCPTRTTRPTPTTSSAKLSSKTRSRPTSPSTSQSPPRTAKHKPLSCSMPGLTLQPRLPPTHKKPSASLTTPSSRPLSSWLPTQAT